MDAIEVGAVDWLSYESLLLRLPRESRPDDFWLELGLLVREGMGQVLSKVLYR
jgi:hypothetical protein